MGSTPSSSEHALILVADHAQTPVHRGLPLAELLGHEWSVLQPSDDRPELAQLAVSPTGRAAHVYLLPGEGERADAGRGRRPGWARSRGSTWSAGWRTPAAQPLRREEPGMPPTGGEWAVVERTGECLRFRPGDEVADLRGGRWEIEGEHGGAGGDDRGRPAAQRGLPGPAGPRLVGADRAALRRLHRLPGARLRGGRLGRRHPRRRRQPRRPARRRLARPAALRRLRPGSRPTSASSGPCATSPRWCSSTSGSAQEG